MAGHKAEWKENACWADALSPLKRITILINEILSVIYKDGGVGWAVGVRGWQENGRYTVGRLKMKVGEEPGYVGRGSTITHSTNHDPETGHSHEIEGGYEKTQQMKQTIAGRGWRGEGGMNRSSAKIRCLDRVKYLASPATLSSRMCVMKERGRRVDG
ncbi:hypothetical protein CEXT_663411 [Caerostris extrusa]|uniref:Uncharacterized protein n=1 Tax=Caerostris extrusa TaxID=172846 RepID=A0AAV4RXT2_CAEEX|nr:hypothetical protein CEXT_663411 [Caerostris extrusa]